MKIKYWILLILVVGLSVLFGYLYFIYLENTYRQPYEAIPSSVTLLLEFEGSASTGNKLTESRFHNILDSIAFTKELHRKIEGVEAIFRDHERVYHTYRDGEMYLSLHRTGKSSHDWLAIWPQSRNILDLINYSFWDELTGRLRKKQYEISYKDYRGQRLYTVKGDQLHAPFHGVYRNGLLIGSYTRALVEEAIERLDMEASLRDAPCFRKMYTNGSSYDATLYLNFSTLPSLLKTIVDKPYHGAIAPLQNWACWSRFDLLIKPYGMLFSGYTKPPEEAGLGLQQYNGQEPRATDMWRMLPARVAFLYWQGLRDPLAFADAGTSDYALYRKYILPWEGHERALAYFNIHEDLYPVVIIEAPEEQAMLQTLMPRMSGSDTMYYENQLLFSLTIDSNIQTQLFNHLPALPASEIAPAWGVWLNGYAAFAAEPFVLKQLVDDYLELELLSRSVRFIPLSENLSSTANLMLYLNNPMTFDLWNALLQTPSGELLESFPYWRQFGQLAIQFANLEGRYYTNAAVLYEAGYEATKPKPQDYDIQARKLLLDTAAAISPQLVKNHYTGNDEVIVQDMNHKLYLFDPAKKEPLWTRKLEARIKSPVRQLDYYTNGKLQYVFNTDHHIHLIDRKGRDVEDFPLKLPAEAANPMLLVNYDNKRKYRYFIAGTDNNLYGFYKDGDPLPGWNPKRNVGVIHLPLRHFFHNGKDYLVAVNEQGTVYGFDRRGQVRVPTKKLNTRFVAPFYGQADEDGYHFTSADTMGVVYCIPLAGEVKKVHLGTFSGNHHFACADVTGDGKGEYIYLDDNELKVYGADAKQRFSYIFQYPVADPPVLVQTETDKPVRIGVVSDQDKQLYLFDAHGRPIDGFPLRGATAFEVGDVFGDGTYHLVTSDKQGQVYLYRLSE